jgi:hypothetical protein
VPALYRTLVPQRRTARWAGVADSARAQVSLTLAMVVVEMVAMTALCDTPPTSDWHQTPGMSTIYVIGPVQLGLCGRGYRYSPLAR